MQCIKENFRKEYILIDIEARSGFLRGFITVQMKFSIGYNPYDMREKIINKSKSDKYPLCEIVKDYSHIVQCLHRKPKNQNFIKKFKMEIKKIEKSKR